MLELTSPAHLPYSPYPQPWMDEGVCDHCRLWRQGDRAWQRHRGSRCDSSLKEVPLSLLWFSFFPAFRVLAIRLPDLNLFDLRLPILWYVSPGRVAEARGLTI